MSLLGLLRDNGKVVTGRGMSDHRAVAVPSMDDSIPVAVSMETYPVSRSQSIWSSPSPLRQHEIKRGIIYKWLERISGYSGEGPMTYPTPLPWEKVSSQQAGLTADLMKTGGCFAARTTFYMWLYTSVELQLMGQNSRGNTGSRSFESRTHKNATPVFSNVLYPYLSSE